MFLKERALDKEECARLCKAGALPVPSRNTIAARLRDRGISSLKDGKDLTATVGARPSPRPTKPLELVQIDHTLVDIMVVDDLQRESMGRPWVTIAFDVATRVVLAFILSLNPPSATSVGLSPITRAELERARDNCRYYIRMGDRTLSCRIGFRPTETTKGARSSRFFALLYD